MPLIRPSTPEDIPTVQSIYAWNVIHGTGTFEMDPPGVEEMHTRRQTVLDRGLPWLVIEDRGQVMGYAYASPFRLRKAWENTVEDSIYMAPEAQHRGLGTPLLMELLAQCTARGARQVLAVIGDSANTGSIALHRRCGFTHVGTMTSVGFKAERWLDCLIMQRRLGAGDTAPPSKS